MVYTYGCIDIILKRSALDRNPKKNSQYLISSENIEEDYYDDDLICVPGGMSPADAESSVYYYEREYNITIFDKSDPKHYVAKDGVIISGPFGATTKCDWIRKEEYGWVYVNPLKNSEST